MGRHIYERYRNSGAGGEGMYPWAKTHDLRRETCVGFGLWAGCLYAVHTHAHSMYWPFWDYILFAFNWIRLWSLFIKLRQVGKMFELQHLHLETFIVRFKHYERISWQYSIIDRKKIQKLCKIFKCRLQPCVWKSRRRTLEMEKAKFLSLTRSMAKYLCIYFTC